MKRVVIKKQINYALCAATVLMIVTGLGITEPGFITPLTLGFFNKLTSYRLHTLLWGPFTILVILHLTMNAIPKKWIQ